MTHPADQPFDVRSLALTLRAGHAVAPHRHPWGQLLFGRRGLMRVLVGDQLWFIPPTRALWIPPETEHQFSLCSDVTFRSLYLAPARATRLVPRLHAIEVAPLLRELVLYIASLGMLDSRIPAQDRMAEMLVDLIAAASPLDLILPMPSNRAARRLAEHLQHAPHDNRRLSHIASDSGASLRTLQRHFVEETGMTIENWRQKARMVTSTVTLGEGQSVTQTALASGYNSPSAFSAAFKRQFGITPKDYAQLSQTE